MRAERQTRTDGVAPAAADARRRDRRRAHRPGHRRVAPAGRAGGAFAAIARRPLTSTTPGRAPEERRPPRGLFREERAPGRRRSWAGGRRARNRAASVAGVARSQTAATSGCDERGAAREDLDRERGGRDDARPRLRRAPPAGGGPPARACRRCPARRAAAGRSVPSRASIDGVAVIERPAERAWRGAGRRSVFPAPIRPTTTIAADARDVGPGRPPVQSSPRTWRRPAGRASPTAEWSSRRRRAARTAARTGRATASNSGSSRPASARDSSSIVAMSLAWKMAAPPGT